MQKLSQNIKACIQGHSHHRYDDLHHQAKIIYNPGAIHFLLQFWCRKQCFVVYREDAIMRVFSCVMINIMTIIDHDDMGVSIILSHI